MVDTGRNFQFYIRIFLIFAILTLSYSKENSKKDKEDKPEEKWKKKDIRDYSEADLERLLDQWEENDEEKLEEDELPEWKREPPKVDMSKFDPKKPEEMLQMSKKGRTLMMFATVSGDPSEKETEKITSLWHTSLFNAHIDTQRYVVGNNRVIFMLTDGSKAWEVKDFLVKQDRCEEVTIEGKSYPGKAGGKKEEKKKEGKIKDDKKKTDSNKIKEKSKTKKTSDKQKSKDENIDDNRTERKKTEL